MLEKQISSSLLVVDVGGMMVRGSTSHKYGGLGQFPLWRYCLGEHRVRSEGTSGEMCQKLRVEAPLGANVFAYISSCSSLCAQNSIWFILGA